MRFVLSLSLVAATAALLLACSPEERHNGPTVLESAVKSLAAF